MSAPTITPLPSAPNRNSPGDQFSSEAADFVGALVTFAQELDSFGGWLNSNALVSYSWGNGTAAAPSIHPANDPDTGWFFPEANHMAASTGGTQRLTINSAGNVGIGTGDPQGRLHVDGNTVLGSTSGGTHNGNVRFQDSDQYPSLRVYSGDTWKNTEILFNANVGSITATFDDASGFFTARSYDGSSYSNVLRVEAGAVRPGVNGSIDLGTNSVKWDDIHAVNGVIQTSDAREKANVTLLSDAEKRVAKALREQIVTFQWLSAVEEKGDAARLHSGLIAQEVAAAFEAEGLDPARYALFVKAPRTRTETELVDVERPKVETITRQRSEVAVIDGRAVRRTVEETITQPVVERVPLFDEDGTPVTEGGEQVYHDVPVLETVQEEREIEVPDGERLGLRYAELACFMMAGL